MPKGSLNMSLKGADDIFSTEESRQEQQREQVQQIPIGELHPFTNHPFKVVDDEAMTRTVESIAQFGVLAPLMPMKNNTTRTIRSEEITIDVRICAALAVNRGCEVYLAAIAPDMELTVITLDEAPGILPCFDEDDACLNLPNTSLLLCYNPAQVLKMGGRHYLTGPVILVRTNMDGEVISLTIDEVYLFQKYLASHSITLMADDQKLPCICID